jgi:hypothetical protein
MLRDAIYADASLLALYHANDDSNLLAALNVANVPVRDTTLRTTRWLMLNFDSVVDPATGETEADLVLGAMQAAPSPRVKAGYDAMGSLGIDLSDPQVQTMIDVLGSPAGWSADLIARLKAVGVTGQTSLAGQSIGRDAVQSDIDLVRRNDVWESQAEQIDMAKNEYLAGAKAAAVLRMQAVLAQLEA